MSTGPTDGTLVALRRRRTEILEVARRRKAANVRVFGSVARGEAGPESDVDCLVTMAPDATLIDLIGLEQDLTALLGREVDVVTDDAIGPLFVDDPRATSVRLWCPRRTPSVSRTSSTR